MKDTINNILDNFYNNFFMRDILGKILPGLILLFSLNTRFIFINCCDELLKKPNFYLVSIIILISYINGLCIQFLGYSSTLILINRCRWGQNPISLEDWMKNRKKFLINANVIQLKHAERFAVVKEISGNNGISLIFSAILIFFSNNTYLYKFKYIIIILMLIIAILLILMNRNAWKIEKIFMEDI